MNWWRVFVFLPMHCGLRDNVADFRKCTRSIWLDPVSSFMYWRMNWHLEHHMYAGVPCYNLRKLRKAIEFDLPVAKNAIAAFREMRATWKRQQIEPGYQYDTPLPPTANPGPPRLSRLEPGRRPRQLDRRPGPGCAQSQVEAQLPHHEAGGGVDVLAGETGGSSEAMNTAMAAASSGMPGS